MGKHLSKYQNEEDYNNNKDNHVKPHISLITTSPKKMKYEKKHLSYITEYFTIEALEDGLTASLSTNTCEYSLDGNTWKNLSAAVNTPAVNTGEKIYFRGNLTSKSTFTISKKCNVKGNIMSLLHGDDFVGQTDLTGRHYAFNKLFYNCINIVDASNLILPATTLANYCCQGMFYGCTSLTTAPKVLPATTADSTSCYDHMFYGCTSLTTAPELSATTLGFRCYYHMFDGCTSLTTAPELSATRLDYECCSYMFRGCTSLVEAPKLPATKLANYCYSQMFYGCTSLVEAPELPATILADHCYYHMFDGCTSLVEAPKLPATKLVNECYSHMFYGCTSLTTAPKLPATTLVERCYESMFNGCRKLTNITMLATDENESNCLLNWTINVASMGTFIKHPDMNLDSLSTGNDGIPSGWTVKDYYTITSYKNLSITADNVVWNGTNTIINWSVICEAISYDNQIIEFVLTGNTVSDSFEHNASDADIIREISFTYMGMTANTTIIQYAYTEGSYSSDYLTFTNTGDDTLLISIFDMKIGGVYAHSFSIDNGDWIEGNMEEEVYAIISPNQSVRFKSNFEPFSIESAEEPSLKVFLIVGVEENNPSCSISGNIMSLLYGDAFIDKTDLTGYDYVFCRLFAQSPFGVDSPITDVSNLVLPATTLANYCYSQMFYDCTRLVESPQLLGETLASGCYEGMFEGCNNLNKITMLATDISAPGCLDYWVLNVASNGIFTKHPDMTSLPSGDSGIPNGWTVVDYIESNLITFPIYLTCEPEISSDDSMTVYKYVFNVDGKQIKNIYFNEDNLIYEELMNRTEIKYGTIEKYPIYLNGVLISNAYMEGTLESNNSTYYIEIGVPLTYPNEDYEYEFLRIEDDKIICEYHIKTYDNEFILEISNSEGDSITMSLPYMSGLNWEEHCATDFNQGLFITNDTDIYVHLDVNNADISEFCNELGCLLKDHSNCDYILYNPEGNPIDKTSLISSDMYILKMNNNNLITFTIDGVEYQAEEGMTWEEWINSEYNTDGFYISEKYNYKYVFFSNADFVMSTTGGVVDSNVIIKPIKYTSFTDTGGGGGGLP